MTLDAKDQVRRQFGDHARDYRTSVSHASGPSLTRVVELAQPRPEWSALDVSTGAGHMAIALAARVRRIFALDITAPMLVEAAGLARERGVSNIEYVLADAERLPLRERSIDLVTNRIALHHYPDPRASIREVARVLKPDGIFVLVDNTFPGDPATVQYLNDFERLRDPSHQWAFPVQDLIEMISASGLQAEHTETLPKQRDLEDWAVRMGCDAATIRELERRVVEAPAKAGSFFRMFRIGDRLGYVADESIVVARKES